MKRTRMRNILLKLVVVAVIVLCSVALSDRRVHAGVAPSCPVTNVVPDSSGGAVVTFDCVTVTVTIHEAVWP